MSHTRRGATMPGYRLRENATWRLFVAENIFAQRKMCAQNTLREDRHGGAGPCRLLAPACWLAPSLPLRAQ